MTLDRSSLDSSSLDSSSLDSSLLNQSHLDQSHLDVGIKLGKRFRHSTVWMLRLLMLAVLIGGGFALYRVVKPGTADRPIQATPIERSSLPITVSANGTVQPEQSSNISPKSSGRLERVLVDEGDVVTAGQVLAYMDDSDLQGQQVEAEGKLAAAQANLTKLVAGNRPQDIAQAQARLSSAQASLQQAEADFRRYDQLYSAGAVSAQERDTALATRDSDRAAVTEAQQALALSQAGNRQEDIEQARAEVTQAQGALQTIQAQIDDTVIRAPFNGVVITRYADPGDFVAPTTSASETSSATSSSILKLGSTYQVVANVAESNISKINVGQSVILKADAYLGQTFAGRVAQIAEGATVESNVTSFEVRVNILSDPKRLLRSDMNVTAEFQVGELNNAIVVPTVAIVRQTNQTGVLILDKDDQPVFTPIQTGVTVGNQTEVTSGLQGNEQVVISGPSQSATPSKERSSFPPRPPS